MKITVEVVLSQREVETVSRWLTLATGWTLEEVDVVESARDWISTIAASEIRARIAKMEAELNEAAREGDEEHEFT